MYAGGKNSVEVNTMGKPTYDPSVAYAQQKAYENSYAAYYSGQNTYLGTTSAMPTTYGYPSYAEYGKVASSAPGFSYQWPNGYGTSVSQSPSSYGSTVTASTPSAIGSKEKGFALNGSPSSKSRNSAGPTHGYNSYNEPYQVDVKARQKGDPPPLKKPKLNADPTSSDYSFAHNAPNSSNFPSSSYSTNSNNSFSYASSTREHMTDRNQNESKHSGSTSSDTQASSGSAWPPSLVDYVSKCYQVTPESDYPALEAKLAELVKLAHTTGTLWTRDWSSLPVPSLHQPQSQQQPASSYSSTHYAPAQGSSEQYRTKHVKPYSASASPSILGKPSKLSSKSSYSSTSDQKDLASPAYPTGKGKLKVPKSSSTPPLSNKSKSVHFSESDLTNQEQLRKRSQRFSTLTSDSSSEDERSNGKDLYSDAPIVGTCQNLEKAYLRLTSRADPATVRPEHILMDAYELMKRKYKQGADWLYVGDQFKAIRLDLTIQQIVNEFTATVYEQNARYCLEQRDMQEFKTCLLRIGEFHEHLNVVGSPQSLLEFCLYKIVFTLFVNDLPALNRSIATIDNSIKRAPEVVQVLKVCDAYSQQNWTQFFRYRPTVAVDALVKHLGFIQLADGKNPEQATKQCRAYLVERNAVFTDTTKTKVEVKGSLKALLAYEEAHQPGK